ncbi:hypothetical protein AB0K18_09005 [Nonomuraea sp. NPDC049421]|uniref:hypothetical protein n=1 Tax=Nonomuraea sp. NPDC049421 TaxID=3155275 RepID=UPI00342150FA
MTHTGDHHAPEGLRTRGTVIVVPGRGETRATYARLGARLAYDAYRVRVVDAPVAGPAAAPCSPPPLRTTSGGRTVSSSPASPPSARGRTPHGRTSWTSARPAPPIPAS